MAALPRETRNVLVTGCSGGIGLALAAGLQARGYRVFAAARRRDDAARLTAQGLQGVILDLDDSTSIRRAVSHVLDSGDGRLYALINNAGYGQYGAVEDLSRAVLRAQFETNLFGTVELTNLIIPVLRAQGYGRIVNNGSILGLVALPYRGAYTASKFALEGLTDTLRLELAGSRIEVALIEPGPVLSGFRASALRAFESNIDRDASVHREAYRALEDRFRGERPGKRACKPDAVLRATIHALESRRPRARYFVGSGSAAMALLRRVLPCRLLDHLSRRLA
jgi:NAD(P)-dependent dehydrogenase (short-subunit alcohol dehydrogenase family)